MKSVMISVKPKWCELIANGEKTIDVRKTKPKIETPFKCYIYCTKEKYKNKYLHTSNKKNRLLFWHNKGDCEIVCQPENTSYIAHSCFGKVIGEFVCDEIRNRTLSNLLIKEDAEKALYGSCLSEEEVLEYLAVKKGISIFDCNGFNFYCWHISDLKIYDEPKELSEFYRLDKPIICNVAKCGICEHWKYMRVNANEFDYDCDCNYQLENRIAITRPPKSWCYVESVNENGARMELKFKDIGKTVFKTREEAKKSVEREGK